MLLRPAIAMAGQGSQHLAQLGSNIMLVTTSSSTVLGKRPRTGRDVGHPVTILPPSFTGSRRYMHARYLDAMALKEHKHPDLFIIFKANPSMPRLTFGMVLRA
jgi:hypothetical protein